jgi:hypothetical protein
MGRPRRNGSWEARGRREISAGFSWGRTGSRVLRVYYCKASQSPKESGTGGGCLGVLISVSARIRRLVQDNERLGGNASLLCTADWAGRNKNSGFGDGVAQQGAKEFV